MPWIAQGRGRWPAGLLGMLALVAAIEAGLRERVELWTNPPAADWQATARAARRHAPGHEVLCLGDSMVKYGILPRVVEATARRPAYNLAISAGTPTSSFFLLRQALEAGACPEAVIIDFIPHLLAADNLWGYRRLWPELLGFRDAAELAWSAGDAGLFADLALAKLLVSYRGRHELRSAVVAALDGRSTAEATRSSVALQVRNTRANKGASVVPYDPVYRGDDRTYADAFYPPRWSVHPLNARYVRKLVRLAAAHDVRVFWVILPFSTEVQEKREQLGLEARYARFARAVQARHPEIVVVDARTSGYDQTLHADPIHLNRKGACALSADLGTTIAAHLGGPVGGWVSLPPFRDRPEPARVEDLAQSQERLARRR